MAGGMNAIRHAVRCHRRIIIMATTGVRIMTTGADTGRIAVTDTTKDAATTITVAVTAIIATERRNNRNKNGTVCAVPFFIA